VLILLILPFEWVSSLVLINLIKHLIFNIINGDHKNYGISGIIFLGVDKPLVTGHVIRHILGHEGYSEQSNGGVHHHLEALSCFLTNLPLYLHF